MEPKKIVDFAKKRIKDTIMSGNKTDRSKHADTIIRNHILLSVGASFIPIFLADIFAVGALQLDMIRQLCKAYDVDFSENRGKAIVSALTSSTLAKVGARSLIKLIPGIGSIIGGVTVSIFAGASTYAVGEVFKTHFESGGTILDFDPERFKNFYKEKFEKGKKVAEKMKEEEEAKKKAEEAAPEPTPQAATNTATENKAEEDKSVIEKLKELAALRDNGIISEEEFGEMKKKLIDQF